MSTAQGLQNAQRRRGMGMLNNRFEGPVSGGRYRPDPIQAARDFRHLRAARDTAGLSSDSDDVGAAAVNAEGVQNAQRRRGKGMLHSRFSVAGLSSDDDVGAAAVNAKGAGTWPLQVWMNARVNTGRWSASSGEKSIGLSNAEVRQAFMKFDKNGNGAVSKKEFLQICLEELGLALTDVEVRRLFANLDTNQSGELSFAKFRQGVERSALFRAVASSYNMKVDMEVPKDYDFNVPTYVTHRHPAFIADSADGTSSVKEYDVSLHGPVFGEFADIRKTLDYTYHTNYTPERQAWQDHVVRRIAQSARPQYRPWVVFTCGAMGSGKGHTMSWLSRHDVLPLEHIVYIDSDHVKCLMPEWKGYTEFNSETAGTMCHKESGYVTEIAQEVAMLGSQHVWIDGSLGDHHWYTHVFRTIRQRFPKYRIALLFVHCSREQIFERAARRARSTGRVVPTEVLEESIELTRKAFHILSRKADFSARIDNRSDIPWVESCQDRSHSLVSLRNMFRLSEELKRFPEALGFVSVKRHEILSEQLDLPEWACEALFSGSTAMLKVPVLEACKPELRGLVKRRLADELQRFSRDPECDLQEASEEVFLIFSPGARVNLDFTSRRIADVPASAYLFTVCHGCCRRNGQPLEILPRFGPGAGAFVYFDERGQIVGVNTMGRRIAVREQYFLHYIRPKPLPSDVDWGLELGDRWVRQVTPPDAVEAAEAVAWLLPGELPECPFGGLAYRLYHGPEMLFPLACSE